MIARTLAVVLSVASLVSVGGMASPDLQVQVPSSLTAPAQAPGPSVWGAPKEGVVEFGTEHSRLSTVVGSVISAELEVNGDDPARADLIMTVSGHLQYLGTLWPYETADAYCELGVLSVAVADYIHIFPDRLEAQYWDIAAEQWVTFNPDPDPQQLPDWARPVWGVLRAGLGLWKGAFGVLFGVVDVLGALGELFDYRAPADREAALRGPQHPAYSDINHYNTITIPWNVTYARWETGGIYQHLVSHLSRRALSDSVRGRDPRSLWRVELKLRFVLPLEATDPCGGRPAIHATDVHVHAAYKETLHLKGVGWSQPSRFDAWREGQLSPAVRSPKQEPGAVWISPTRTPRPSVTVFCLDVSGSMNYRDRTGMTRIEAARRAVNDVISLAEAAVARGEIHEIGLVTFAAESHLAMELSADFDELRRVVEAISAGGGTNMGAGLLTTLDLLADVRDASVSVILLSDGASNTGLSNAAILSGPAAEMARLGHCLHVVALGDEAAGEFNLGFLEALARAAGCETNVLTSVEMVQLRQAFVRSHISDRQGDTLVDWIGHISMGEMVDVGSYSIPSTSLPIAGHSVGRIAQLHAVLTWPGSRLSLRLQDPAGSEVDEHYPGSHFTEHPGFLYVAVQDPIPGVWTSAVFGEDVPIGGIEFSLLVALEGLELAEGTHMLEAHAYPNPVEGDGSATFTVRGAGARSVERIRVRVSDLSGYPVYQGETDGASLRWDTLDVTGIPVHSGIYSFSIAVYLENRWVHVPLERLLIMR